MDKDEKQDQEQKSHQQRASQLFIEYYSYVRYISLMVAPARDLVDDIVNDTFIAFTQSSEKWNLDEDVKPLLRQITINAAKVIWRKHVRQLPERLAQIAELVRVDIASHEFDTEHGNVNQETDALRLCLEKLSPKSLELVQKHYFHNQSVQEIVQEGQWNQWALYKSLMRIRLVLKTCIERILEGYRHGS